MTLAVLWLWQPRVRIETTTYAQQMRNATDAGDRCRRQMQKADAEDRRDTIKGRTHLIAHWQCIRFYDRLK